MEILARFNYDKLDHTKVNTPHLVVSLKTPALDWVEKRPAIAILPCIDLSGSMQGDKLAYAKQSVLKLIEHLAEGDVAGLVTFDNHAQVVVTPAKVTGDFKAKLSAAVEKLQIGGGTNLAEGIVSSIDVIQKLDLPPSFLHRIILFTDGQPTMGITNPKAILKLLNKKRARATVSAFGYGEGNCSWGGIDHDFLTALSTQGKGNYAYVKDPDDALGAFGKELGGLLSTYATNLMVEINPSGGHRIQKVVTNIEHEEDVTGVIEIPISDILGEETRHLVFETALAEQKKCFPRETTVFDVRVTYEVLTEDGARETHSAETKARVRFVREDEAQAKAHAEVDQILALHQMIRAQLDAEEEAKKGNFEGAVMFMQEVQQNVAARGHFGVATAARLTGDRLGSASLYANSGAYLNSVANAGTRAYGTSRVDDAAAVVLESCNVAMSSPTQDSYQASFEATPAPPAAVDLVSADLVIPSSTTGKSG